MLISCVGIKCRVFTTGFSWGSDLRRQGVEHPPQKPFARKLHVHEIPKLQGSLETILLPEPLLEAWRRGTHCGLGIYKSVFKDCVREMGEIFKNQSSCADWESGWSQKQTQLKIKSWCSLPPPPPLHPFYPTSCFSSSCLGVFLINLCNPMGSL